MTNEGLNARVDKMAAWATEVNKKLESLSIAHSNHHRQTVDPVVGELNDHWQTYDNIPGKIKDKRFELIDLEMAAKQCKEAVDDIADNTALNISMEVNDEGKLTYSNESMRKAAAAKRLRINPEYAAAIEQQRGADRLALQCKVEIEYLENMMSEFSRRNRALVSRIEYATALIKG